jgi:hypothetical protein
MTLKTIGLGLLFPLCLSAQESADTSRLGLITVRSRPSGASVFIDSVFAGKTPLERHQLPSGEHEMKVFYPSVSDWNAFVQQKSFRLDVGSEIESSFEFGSILTLHSVPSGAVVSFLGNELGRTPLLYRSNTTLQGNVMLGLDDYKSVSVAISEKPSVVRLEYLRDSQPPSELTVEYPSVAPQRKWMSIGSAAGMVVFGVAAAYFKDRANRDFERFASTADPAFLSSTDKYDRLSLISLIMTQATFGLLIYSLLSDN